MALASAVAFAFGCAAGSSEGDGLDGGGTTPTPDSGGLHDSGAGFDTGRPGSDSGNLFTDTGSNPKPDGTVGDTGSSDVTLMDGGSGDVGVKDSGSGDTGVKDTGTKDTGSGDSGSCVTVTLNSGANDGGACPAPVVGVCGMGDVAGYTPTWIPPSGMHQNLCTSAAMSGIYDGCFALGATNTTCNNAFTKYATCAACIFSDEGASATYGPIIDTTNGISEVNQAGCIALLEPCNLTCAKEVQGATACENAACETNCDVTDGGTFNDFETCLSTAANCDPNGCDTFATQATCEDEITGASHPASGCVTQATFQDFYNFVVPLFCGP